MVSSDARIRDPIVNTLPLPRFTPLIVMYDMYVVGCTPLGYYFHCSVHLPII